MLLKEVEKSEALAEPGGATYTKCNHGLEDYRPIPNTAGWECSKCQPTQECVTECPNGTKIMHCSYDFKTGKCTACGKSLKPTQAYGIEREKELINKNHMLYGVDREKLQKSKITNLSALEALNEVINCLVPLEREWGWDKAVEDVSHVRPAPQEDV